MGISRSMPYKELERVFSCIYGFGRMIEVRRYWEIYRKVLSIDLLDVSLPDWATLMLEL